MLHVALQDHRRVCRETLPQLLNTYETITVVGAAGTDSEFIALCGRTRPDVGVLDLDADESDPRALAAELRAVNPSLRLVGIGHADGGTDIRVPSDTGIAELVDAIRSSVTQNRSRRSNSGKHLPTSRGAQLTARQAEVLRLVSEGLSAAQISEALQVSSKTVEHHKREIFTRLAVQSQAQAVAVALRHGILTTTGEMP